VGWEFHAPDKVPVSLSRNAGTAIARPYVHSAGIANSIALKTVLYLLPCWITHQHKILHDAMRAHGVEPIMFFAATKLAEHHKVRLTLNPFPA